MPETQELETAVTSPEASTTPQVEQVSDAKATEAPSTSDPGAKPPLATSPTASKPDAKIKSIDIARRVVGDTTAAPSTEVKDLKPGDPAAQAAQDSQLPFHAHPRWQEVTKENATLKQQNAELQQQLPVLKDGAERHEALLGFMGQHDLQADEVTELLKFGAMAKSRDPAVLKQCADALSAISRELYEGLGEVLPTDLQQKVDQGLLDEASAKELAKQRGRTAMAEDQVKQTDAQRQAAASRQRDQEVLTTIVNWENDIRSKDLGYDKKMEKLVAAECARLIAEAGNRKPTNAPNAKKLMDTAYKNVLENLDRKPQPRPAVSTSRSTTSAASAPALQRKGMKSIDVSRAIMQGQRIAD